MLAEFGEHDRKLLRCLEQTVSRNMSINASSRLKEASSRIEKTFIRYHCEQTVDRNMDIKGAAGEGSGENVEEISIINRNWRTGILVIL